MYDEIVQRLRLAEAVLSRNKDLRALLSESADAIEELATNYDAATDIMKHQTEYIEELEAKLPCWIPVTERLPKEHILVLVVNDDGKFMVGERAEEDWWYQYFAYDVDRWDAREQGVITHWMPLPEPPCDELFGISEQLPKEET